MSTIPTMFSDRGTSMALPIEAVRQEFEEWYAKRHPRPVNANPTWAHASKMDDWEVWQAARSNPSLPRGEQRDTEVRTLGSAQDERSASEDAPLREMYTPLELPEGTPELELCPCCASAGKLFQFQKTEGGPATKVIMCENGEQFGPQDGIANEGCPLYMPDDDHYRATIREAVTFWNEYAKALTALQRKNRWARAQVLRGAASNARSTGGAV